MQIEKFFLDCLKLLCENKLSEEIRSVYISIDIIYYVFELFERSLCRQFNLSIDLCKLNLFVTFRLSHH